MELYEIHSNPTEQGEDHMLLLWGTPIPFPSKKLWRMYGPSHPIAIDNRAKERDIDLWV